MQKDKDGKIIILQCNRKGCQHIWIPRLSVEKVRQCPACKRMDFKQLSK